MNKYYQTLDKILQTGKTQTNKKGCIKYLLNERLMLTPADLLDIGKPWDSQKETERRIETVYAGYSGCGKI